MPPAPVTKSETQPGEVDGAFKYIFEEYNVAKDGNMTRREFFRFLWELKQTAKQTINEGQMMSCWIAVSRRKETIDYEDFKNGVEICYERAFFAKENNADAPVFSLKEEDPSSYDTVKFKSSAGVKAFDSILEDEQKKKTTPAARPMTLYGQAKSSDKGGPSFKAGASSRENREPREPRVPPPVAPRPAGLKKEEMPTFVKSPNAKIELLKKEREVKKMENQKKMDQIMAARYQEQRKERELRRQQEEEEKAAKRAQEAEQLVAEPAWMKNLKDKKRY